MSHFLGNIIFKAAFEISFWCHYHWTLQLIFSSMYRNKNEKVKPLSWLFSLPVLLFNGSNRRTNIDVNGGFCMITALWFCTMWRKLADRISRKINEWAVINKNPDILQHSLRRIYNVRWPEMIPNKDLWERAGQEPVAKQILKRK